MFKQNSFCRQFFFKTPKNIYKTSVLIYICKEVLRFRWQNSDCVLLEVELRIILSIIR